ncbi:MAG: DNA starvation/stationary phase protection protein Dps, partial [Candidatus Acidiferrum sp.]
TATHREVLMPKAATATSTVRTYPTSIGVPEHNRQAIIALLNARLADSTDLRTQVKWAHWNVKGLHFIQLHELFDSIAAHLEDQTDTIAERAAALGGVANGTVREAAAKSGLKEADLSASDGPSMLKFLVHNVAHHANAVRTAIQESDDLGDATTADLFTQLSRELDKDLWFLEAHLTQS